MSNRIISEENLKILMMIFNTKDKFESFGFDVDGFKDNISRQISCIKDLNTSDIDDLFNDITYFCKDIDNIIIKIDNLLKNEISEKINISSELIRKKVKYNIRLFYPLHTIYYKNINNYEIVKSYENNIKNISMGEYLNFYNLGVCNIKYVDNIDSFVVNKNKYWSYENILDFLNDKIKYTYDLKPHSFIPHLNWYYRVWDPNLSKPQLENIMKITADIYKKYSDIDIKLIKSILKNPYTMISPEIINMIFSKCWDVLFSKIDKSNEILLKIFEQNIMSFEVYKELCNFKTKLEILHIDLEKCISKNKNIPESELNKIKLYIDLSK